MKFKSIFLSLFITIAISLFSLKVNAQKKHSGRTKTEHVSGYTKKNCTHVSSYRRSRKS